MPLPNRHSIRLPDFDYSSPGFYFVTICTQNRQNILAEIKNQKIKLTVFGKIVNKIIKQLEIYQNINIDTYCLMPNHIHLILIINPVRVDHPNIPVRVDHRVDPIILIKGQTQRSAPTLGIYIKRFKTLTTNIYIKNIHEKHWPMFNKRIWQRNYHEHIIRNQTQLAKIKQYIKLNPTIWHRDRNNPNNSVRV